MAAIANVERPSLPALLPSIVAKTPFSPRLHACITLLNARFRLSDRLIKKYLETFYFLRISFGSISYLQKRITPCLWPLAQEVRAYLHQLPWVHAGETPHWHKREQHCVWVLAAPLAYFQTHYSRRMKISWVTTSGADKGYEDKAREQRLIKTGWRLHIQHKAKKGKSQSACQKRRNTHIASPRVRVRTRLCFPPCHGRQSHAHH